jgi:ketol-acid reductoisomerase
MSAAALQGPVAIIGYGNQGEAHALNLRDAGLDVRVGARAAGRGEARARAAGFTTLAPEGAVRGAATVAMLLPDEVLPALWDALGPALAPHAAVVFAHGFNLLYGDLAFPEGGDVVLVSPTGPGRVLRQVRESGGQLPAYVAVHRDGTGGALDRARAYAEAVGCAPLWPTTVREETEVDLFGEQAVLCGGMNALVTAAFETLVERGYAPEIAYLECVHQLKYLADLLHERGVAGMREGISGTALFGDVTRGPRVIGEESRRSLRDMLEEIRTGAFAAEWKAEVAAGKPRLARAAAAAREHPLEAARRSALGGRDNREPGTPESRNALSKN